MKILFATGNPSKAKRFSKGLLDHNIEVLTLKDLDLDVEVEETGKTAIENALIKARAYSKLVDMPIMAMDDNLYLEGVPEDKQPGTHVRRVDGKRLNDDEMLEHYISLVKDYGIDGKLNCKWVYGMAVIYNNQEYTYTWDKENFYMTDKLSDKINPGYPLNTISINKTLNKYFTDITDEDKLKIKEDESHVVDFIVRSIKNEKNNIYNM